MNRSTFITTVALFFSVAVTSCSKEDPAAEATIFELEAEGSFPASLSAVIVTNIRGDVVAYADVKEGNYLALKADPAEAGERLTITLVEYFAASGGEKDRASFASYAEIAAGSKWVLRKQNSASDQPNEEVAVEIANFPAGQFNHLPLSVSSIGSFIERVSTSGESQPLVCTVELDKPVSDLFLSATGYGDPRYLLLDLTAGTSHSGDFLEDFEVLDELITLAEAREDFYVSIGGHNTASPDFWLKRHVMSEFAGSSEAGLKLGYNGGYTTYSTSWSAAIENGQYLHTRVGDPPSAATFQMEQADFHILSTGFNMFNFETNDSFAYYTVEWLLNNVNNVDEPQVAWKAYFPHSSKHHIMSNLPSELLDKHPGLVGVRNKLSLDNAAIVIGRGGFNYGDYIRITFEEPTVQQTYEYITVKKFYP